MHYNHHHFIEMTESKGRLKLIARLFRMCWLLVGWVGHGGCLRVYEGSFVLLSLMFCVNVTLYWHWSPTNLKRLPIDRQSSYANRICSFCGHFSKAASFDPFVCSESSWESSTCLLSNDLNYGNSIHLLHLMNVYFMLRSDRLLKE